MSERKVDPRLKLDESAAQKAQGTAYSIHPVVDKVSRKLGSFNMIRNAKNQREAMLQEIDDLQG